jgi:hypothetical protein
MIRDDRLVQSRGPYAIDLGSYRKGDPEPGSDSAWCSVQAVWFRKKDGVLRACTGNLHDLLLPPADVTSFLEAMDDGRYGGHCEGRWDGARYWGSQDPREIERHLALLRPMLAGYPLVPGGYQGWWRFPTSAEAEKIRKAQRA